MAEGIVAVVHSPAALYNKRMDAFLCFRPPGMQEIPSIEAWRDNAMDELRQIINQIMERELDDNPGDTGIHY